MRIDAETRRVRRIAVTEPLAGGSADSLAVRRVLPYVGPAAIVLAVLVVLHQLLFGSTIATHIDLLSFWLPQYCFLGKALAAGHIPAWNPHVMIGIPFAADPQSGWMNLPAMLLFASAPCGTALRLYLFAQPVIAGLGLYSFLRTEETSRAAATAGGLVLALAIAGSFIGSYVPFSSSLAWTAVLLAAGARYVRSARWSGRLAWALAAALAWGQVAAAHLSDGMVLASVALGVYVATRTVQQVREGVVGWRLASSRFLLLYAVLPLVNLAFLAPRLAYLPKTSLGLGYERLDAMSRQLTGYSGHTFLTGYRLVASWPLDLVRSPGLYLGATGLALVALGWASRRHRPVVVGFMGFGLLCFVLSINAVAKRLLGTLSSSLAAAYLHAPSRFRFGAVLCLAVLIGYGVEGWRAAETSRIRLLLLAPGVLVWWVGGVLFDRPLHELVLFLVAAAGAIAALAATATRPALLALLPLLIGVELVASGVTAYPDVAPTYPRPVELESWLHPPGMVEALRHMGPGRYLSYAPRTAHRSGGYLGHQEPSDGPFLANGQSMLFGLREVQGYNPVQLPRYWEFIRSGSNFNINYNASFLKEVRPIQIDLLQVVAIIQVATAKPPVPGTLVRREGAWKLVRVEHPAPRATLLTSCRTVPGPEEALRAVYTPDFPSRRVVVLDSGPAVACGPERPGGTVRYRELGPQQAAIDVQAPAAGVVLVRNSWDDGWHATVDGHAAPVLHADALLQGVPVPAGAHTLVLSYDDPLVGLGLLGSAVAVLVLVGAIVLLLRIERSRRATAVRLRVSAPPEGVDEEAPEPV